MTRTGNTTISNDRYAKLTGVTSSVVHGTGLSAADSAHLLRSTNGANTHADLEAVRASVKDQFEQDTLIEAIALELEREHGFTFISDGRLTASVHVSPDDKENRLIALDDELADAAEYRSLFAEYQGDDARN